MPLALTFQHWVGFWRKGALLKALARRGDVSRPSLPKIGENMNIEEEESGRRTVIVVVAL